MMSLIPWRTKRSENGSDAPLATLRHEVDRLFDSVMGDPWGWFGQSSGMSAVFPSIDVSESGNELMVRAELPGVKAADLDVSLADNALVLAGEKKEQHERKEGNYYHSERRFGSFRREVPLPCAVDPDKVDATFADGVLTVRLQKSPEAQARKIEVKGQ